MRLQYDFAYVRKSRHFSDRFFADLAVTGTEGDPTKGAGGWTDAPTAAQTETDIENAILTKARQLRLANMAG